MIHHTVTSVAITTLHLVFVTFTVDIYRTDAAIWSQTETTTDWQDHSSGTAYQQTAATNTPESFTNVASTFHNEFNVSLQNLVSAFNTSSYIANCSDLKEQTDADEFHYISYEDESPDELVRTTWETADEFNTLIKTALWFICTENTTVGHDAVTMSRIYVHNFTEFMVRLNDSTTAIGEVAVRDTVADLYRTSIQQMESVMELVEHLTEIISEEVKFVAMKQILVQQVEAFNMYNKTSDLEIAVGKQKEQVNLLQNISERAGNMSEHTHGNPLINVITSRNIWRFLDAQYWARSLEQETQVLDNYQTMLLEVQDAELDMNKVTPVILAVILVVGITGNGLLLTIFVRHKETRTLANSMLINLTVVDFLSLFLNGVLEHLRVIMPWQFGWLGCNLFFFVCFLLFVVSTYSVSMISVQRFVAIRQLSSFAWCYQSQKTKYVLIATVWGIGCILSVPRALIVGIDSKTEFCMVISFEYLGPMITSELITFCVVPLLITAAFSGVTAYRIRKSIHGIPGEATGQDQFKHNRVVSSNVLFALTGLFVVSYVPFFLFNSLVFLVGVNVNEWVLVNLFFYYLRFVNCCLNPIVVFVLSKRYRGYIKRYCGQRKVQPANKRGGSKET